MKNKIHLNLIFTNTNIASKTLKPALQLGYRIIRLKDGVACLRAHGAHFCQTGAALGHVLSSVSAHAERQGNFSGVNVHTFRTKGITDFSFFFRN